jgi:hypothetical protein
MQAQNLDLGPTEGVHTIEGEFVTENLMICGELSGPDTRLSDHLNSSTANIVIRPSGGARLSPSGSVDLVGSHAAINKAHLLFVVPLREPERPSGHDNAAWKATQPRRAWIGLGRYTVTGKVHTEAWRGAHLVLRDLEQKQFVPLTDVTVTHPDGTTRDLRALIVNRARVELFALRDLS